jgi:uncharacterized protein (TIGR01319 family)
VRVDTLVAEIGSTTTTVSAFDDIATAAPRFLGQAQAPTSVLDGDVRIGLNGAIADLAHRLGVAAIEHGEMLATSSAAGGLKTTVHGLVHDMTSRAAKEAALGAGAILHMVTAGRLRRIDIEKLKQIRPNIILLAGGVDYGERDTALDNAEKLAGLNLPIPLIYAGNVENQDEIRLIFEGTDFVLHIVDNVYPKIDLLNVEPTRKVIQAAFEEHIVHAPGMEHVRDLVDGPIIPTPGAVMAAAKLLYEDLGDLMVLDVGGATTDVYSLSEGSEEINRILISPEPLAKRTVEGDLGVFVNMPNVVGAIGQETLGEHLDVGVEAVQALIDEHLPVPKTPEQVRFTEELARECVLRAVERHAGRIRSLYGLSGKRDIAEGKDLTQVRTIVGTGGALTRLPRRVALMEEIAAHDKQGTRLLPRKEAKVLVDDDYILAAVGVLSVRHPTAALILARRSLGVHEEVSALSL